jgi:hypothetical protein
MHNNFALALLRHRVGVLVPQLLAVISHRRDNVKQPPNTLFHPDEVVSTWGGLTPDKTSRPLAFSRR